MATPTPSCICGVCKVCRARVRRRQYIERDPARKRAQNRAWGKANAAYWRERRAEDPKRDMQRTRTYRERHPEKYRAQTALNNAIKAGKMERGTCEVCGMKAEAHHPDYAQPLVVRWLCRQHHATAHRELTG